jgi:hypothetical protein
VQKLSQRNVVFDFNPSELEPVSSQFMSSVSFSESVADEDTFITPPESPVPDEVFQERMAGRHAEPAKPPVRLTLGDATIEEHNDYLEASLPQYPLTPNHSSLALTELAPGEVVTDIEKFQKFSVTLSDVQVRSFMSSLRLTPSRF